MITSLHHLKAQFFKRHCEQRHNMQGIWKKVPKNMVGWDETAFKPTNKFGLYISICYFFKTNNLFAKICITKCDCQQRFDQCSRFIGVGTQ